MLKIRNIVNLFNQISLYRCISACDEIALIDEIHASEAVQSAHENYNFIMFFSKLTGMWVVLSNIIRTFVQAAIARRESLSIAGSSSCIWRETSPLQAYPNHSPAVRKLSGILSCRSPAPGLRMRVPPFWPAGNPDSEERFPRAVTYQTVCKLGPACQEPVCRRVAGSRPGARFMVGDGRSKAFHLVLLIIGCE